MPAFRLAPAPVIITGIGITVDPASWPPPAGWVLVGLGVPGEEDLAVENARKTEKDEGARERGLSFLSRLPGWIHKPLADGVAKRATRIHGAPHSNTAHTTRRGGSYFPAVFITSRSQEIFLRLVHTCSARFLVILVAVALRLWFRILFFWVPYARRSAKLVVSCVSRATVVSCDKKYAISPQKTSLRPRDNQPGSSSPAVVLGGLPGSGDTRNRTNHLYM